MDGVMLASTLSAAEPAMTLGEKLSIGAEVALIGLLIVFMVLMILWGVLALFKVFFYDIPKRKKDVGENENVKDTAVLDIPAAETAAEPAPVVAATDDLAIIAAITVAISEYTGMPSKSFRVVSFKKSR